MRVAHLSTWACRCGLAEYVQILAARIVAQQHAFVNARTLRSALPSAYRSVAANVPTTPVFRPVYLEGRWWGDDPESLLAFEPEVLHVQFQTNLYDHFWLEKTLRAVRAGTASWRGAKVVFTLHDSGMWAGWDWRLVDAVIVHREETGRHVPAHVRRHVVPQPIPLQPLRLCSFGLGRTPEHAVREALAPHGIDYVTRGYAGETWLSLPELLAWVQGHDGVILWYPETAASVSSSALRMALGARRPVFCSDTSWFREAGGKFVHKFATLEELVLGVRNYFSDPFVEEGSWERVARLHEQIYAGLLEE